MARKYVPNSARIANKLTALIKKRIKDLQLIDTGLMLDSVMVVPNKNGGWTLKTEDYFKYNDGRFDILEHVLNSREFLDYVANASLEDIVIEIKEFK